MVNSFDTIYVIGNWRYIGGGDISPLIASFKDGVWKEVGNIFSARITPNVIKHGPNVLVLGGRGQDESES